MLRTFVRLLQVNPGFDAPTCLRFAYPWRRRSTTPTAQRSNSSASSKKTFRNCRASKRLESFPICRSTTHFRTGTASIGGGRFET